jgi:transcriptional regulator with XRE-family HTH domain
MKVSEIKQLPFKDIIRKERLSQNLSQTELGQLASRSGDQISQLERGVRLPTKKEFDTFCNLFNKKVDYFFPSGVPELFDDYTKSKGRGRRNFGDNKYGTHKMSKEEIENYNSMVRNESGQVFDVENEIQQLEMEIKDKAVEEKVENVEEVTNTEHIKGDTTRKVSISIPIGDKNIVIVVEESIK